jgi:hypothetical protein
VKRPNTHIAMTVPLLLALVASGVRAAPPPASAPAPDPLIEQATQAVADETLVKFAESLDEPIRACLANLGAIDNARLTRLAALREFALYFSRIEKPEDAKELPANLITTQQWLLDHPELLETLMMAVGEQDAPDRVLAVLDALRVAHGEKVAQFPDLAAAMCVVWDTPPNMDEQNPRAETERAVWLFKYLTMARKQLRFDPQDLPWELASFVVDNGVSQDEVAWAMQRYQGRGSIGSVYFDVPYDVEAFLSGADRRIDSQDYTLPNLVRFGGICGDQAYFAKHVARSIGVPACTAVGMGGSSDTAHAWVGFFEVRGRSVAWNFSEGRYPEHQYWRGSVHDPRTRETITDSDVSLLAELANSKSQDRLASIALCKVTDLVSEGQQGELYQRAINLSPGNREAWLRLAQLGADGKLTEAQVASTMRIVADFAARPYPDFAFDIIKRLNNGRGTQQQLRALKDARRMFTSRPDLLAAIRLTEGDLLRDQQKPVAALGAYGEVLRQYHNAGPIVLDALARIDNLLREHDETKRLAAIYHEAWQRLPQPPTSGYARATPYYMVGERYLALLEELGAAQEAARVKARLETLSRSAASR